MAYNTENYWVFGLSQSSGILEIENMTFRKLDLFSSSGEVGEDTYSVRSLPCSLVISYFNMLWVPHYLIKGTISKMKITLRNVQQGWNGDLIVTLTS
jgi:hypothetical protein